MPEKMPEMSRAFIEAECLKVARREQGCSDRCRCSGNGIEFRLWCHVGRRCRCSGNGIEFRLWCHVGRRCRCSGNGIELKLLVGLARVVAAHWNLGTQLKASELEHP